MRIRNPFARAGALADTRRAEKPQPAVEERIVCRVHQDLELDHASRQIDCARHAERAIAREGPRRTRFAAVDDDIFGDNR